ncbi:MAG: pyridoxamine 5'-phosphate oxidase family protein, partial [Actinobacteria bacterium]|nr:pyridoxamine 5'-phosphate oxidase family protein [Actinomycetota bacterium]
TLLDGLVLARSAFESSMNYRSAMVLGVATQLHGDDELDALACITEHLLPGRWLECRHPSAKERAATLTLALDLNECSVKIRTGAPDDDPADLLDPVFSQIWAGEVPLQSMFATPIADENTPTTINVPEYITKWRRP